MVSGYTPDTISSIIDSLCSNLERTHAWKSQWQFHMYTESYRLFAHWHSFFSFSKNVSKKWKFLIIICFELQTFAGFHFPTYIILIHKLHLRLWGFIAEGMYTFLRRHKQRQEDTYYMFNGTYNLLHSFQKKSNTIT